MVTSSLNEISTDQLGNRLVVRSEGSRYSARPNLFLQKASPGRIFKDDINGFWPPSQ
jgi:hypothetical protein